MVGPIDVKQEGNESAGCYADQGTFDIDLWPWISKVKLYVTGMGGLIVMERKGLELIGCPDVKHNHYVTSRQKILSGTGVT